MTNEHDPARHETLCAYVLGEGTPEERSETERELARSPQLRAQCETIERTIGLVKSALAGNESLSPAAAETLVSAASTSRPTPLRLVGSSAVPWLRIAAGIGAVALAFTIVRSSQTVTSSRTADEELANLSSGENKVRKTEQAENLAFEPRADANPAHADRTYRGPGDSVPPSGGSALAAKEREQGQLAEALKPSDQVIDRKREPAQRTTPEVKWEVSLSHGVPAAGELGKPAPKGQDFSVNDLPVLQSSQILERAGSGDRFWVEPDSSSTGGVNVTPLPESSAIGVGPATGRSSPDPFAARTLQRSGDKDGVSKNDVAGKKADERTAAGLHAASPPPVELLQSNERTRQPGTRRLGAVGYGGPDFNQATPEFEELVRRRDELKTRVSRGDVQPEGGVDLVNEELVELNQQIQQRQGLAFDDDSAGERPYYWQLSPAEQQVYLDQRCRHILDGCVRQPNERPRDMYFRFWGDNPFEVAALDKLSTFSADVDTASYTLARRYLNEGHVPEKAQIRTEEFVNYFKSDVPAPTEGVFAIHTDLTPSRFSTDTARQMMRVVVRGKDLSKVERKPLHLTFVVDVSGSMREQNRLEMVKHAIRLLVTQLDQYDRIGIVKFSVDASVVLPLTSVADRATIESKIEPLQPEGSTNSNAGLQLGYAIAMGGIDANSISRVVFLSDGVANVGETDPAKIAEQVKPMREKGIYLNTIGVGMNNHNDVLLEQLADKADGMCNYIDSPEEAKRALVDNFTGAFQPIARDVKIQVEFDPAQVLRYRLLGYENRAIADADFRNDKVDAGEIGAGHQVTALYEIERQSASTSEAPLATVRVRWKEPRNFGANAEQDAATEIAQPVLGSQLKTFEAAGQSYRKAVIVAQFAEILRRSIHARGDSLDDLLAEALRLQKEIPNDADFNELCLLISRSKDLIVHSMPACDELCQAIDAVREANYRRAQLEQLQKDMDAKTLEALKQQNDILEARLRELIKRRLESQGK